MFKIPIPENITFFFDPRTYVPFLDLTDLNQDIICRVLLLHKAQHIDTSVCLRVSIAIIKTWISRHRHFQDQQLSYSEHGCIYLVM